MSPDERIEAYLHSVRSSLHLPKQQRARVLEEIEDHLNDGAAAHMELGASREQAISLVIDELGPPDEVAAGFNDQGDHKPPRSGPITWLPMLAPLILLLPAVGFLAWSLQWFSDGPTKGEQIVQQAYVVRTLVAATLSGAAYLSIKRAHRDHAWRWAAWFCTAVAVAIALAR